MTGRCGRWRDGSKVTATFDNWSEILLRRIGAGDGDRTRNFAFVGDPLKC